MSYIVVNNMPGYLPEDDEPAEFDTLEEAKACLAEDVERYADDYAEDGGYVYRERWSDDRLYCLVTLGEQRGFQRERVFEVVEVSA
jgi:hypothetical protein